MTIFVTPPFFADVQEQEKEKERAKGSRKMPQNKKKSSRAVQLAPHSQTPTAIVSDYDTDTAYHTETQALPVTAPPPNRSPAQLNMLVLQRWYPAITSILAIAPFAVVYSFSPDSQSWDKCDTQGSLFVCQLSPLPGSVAPRYKVIILNRRNPKNFELDLLSAEDIEVTEEFVIIPHVDTETGEAQIYGIWVFRDGDERQLDVRSYTAKVILDCAALAESASDEHLQRDYGEGLLEEDEEYDDRAAGFNGTHAQMQEEKIPYQRQETTGQTIDLATLFGKPVQQQQQPSISSHDSEQGYNGDRFAPSADPAFFRNASNPVGSSGIGSQAPPAGSQQNALLDLFKNAKKS